MLRRNEQPLPAERQYRNDIVVAHLLAPEKSIRLAILVKSVKVVIDQLRDQLSAGLEEIKRRRIRTGVANGTLRRTISEIRGERLKVNDRPDFMNRPDFVVAEKIILYKWFERMIREAVSGVGSKISELFERPDIDAFGPRSRIDKKRLNR